MEIAFLLVAIAVVVLTVTALSERVEIPAPLTLVVVGVAASYVPGVPELRLEPEVVLLGLLPPLLYSAAVNTSLVDFNANRGPILLLSVGLVFFTTAGVGVVVKLVIPDLHWALALAIGAVVAPPDAVAATAIGRRIGMPRRVVTILEGESLLNDASALVALRTAIAALGASVAAWEVGLDFVVAAGGGAAVGGIVFVVVGFIRKKVTDPLLDTAISLVIPFASYILAEEIHASGVVAVVVAGLLLGHVAPILQSAQSRIAERTNWRTIAYVLENTVFLLIGLQADWLLGEVGESEFGAGTIAVACAAALATCVVLRLVWVFAASGLLLRRGPEARTGEPMPMLWRSSFLIGWAGMRGVVTLAAAFTVPEHTEHREVLLIIAFAVVAGTLLGQGMTLPALARRLKVPGPDAQDDALARATLLQQAAKAGIKKLDALAAEDEDPLQVRDLIIQRIEQRNFAAWERLGTTADLESPSDLYARWRGAMIEEERRRVLEIRSTGKVPSEIVSEVLAMLDVEESMLDHAAAQRAEIRAAATRPIAGGCEHLVSTPLLDPPPALACPPCLADGTQWVALRMCLSCGTIGCCDSSPGRHATAHFRESQHPVMRSVEPGEDWRWCYVHHQTG